MFMVGVFCFPLAGWWIKRLVALWKQAEDFKNKTFIT